MANMTVADAVGSIEPFLKPGFVERWRRAGLAVGFRTLGHALKYAVVPETNGQHEAISTLERRPWKPRTNGKDICRWAYKYTGDRLIVNRKHRCNQACWERWDAHKCMEWLASTVLPVVGKVSVPILNLPCTCGLPKSDHYGLAVEQDQLRGFRNVTCEAGYYKPLSSPMMEAILATIRRR